MKDTLAITFLSYNDNPLLFSTIKQFVENTNGLEGVEINVLIQLCCKSYIKSIENLCVYYNKNIKTKFVLHTREENLGVSRANNELQQLTKHFKYVLHIEDDWILKIENKNWLKCCIDFLEQNNEVSTIAFRAYGSEKEKEQYGWTKHIPYVCHQHNGNFNYESKLRRSRLQFYEMENGVYDSINFTQIENYLFTFNPVIRRNSDYYTSNVYPLPEFEDKDLNINYKDGVKIHENEKWGWCEAITMEKTRNLITYMYQDGIFYHFDDNIDLCIENKLSIFKNDFMNFYNINSHYPVLLIHIDNLSHTGHSLSINTNKCKHEFLCFLHFVWNTKISKETHLKNIEKVLIHIKPRCIITIGEIGKENIGATLTRYLPFEYRKKWIHLDSLDKLVIPNVEYCIFNSYKHEGRFYQPLVSVITPAYESKHRIMRPYESLLSQTYNNWEWIIVDDSKTDETWKTLSELADSDHRIKIFRRHRNNGSIGENKLLCSNISQGVFIFELDHDDDIMPSTFDKLINSAKKYPDAGFFYSDCIELMEDSCEPFHYGNYFGFGFGSYYRMWVKNHFQYIYRTHRVNPSTQRHIVGVPNHFRAWTKKAYMDVGGHLEHLQVADDYDLIVRTMNKYRWVHIPELLYLQYRNNGGDNFTFHRNALIQYLVGKLRDTHEEDIHSRFLELNVNDDKYRQNPQSRLDYEINYFQYPIIDYVYCDKDLDKDNPLMSVVIPTYNRPEHLRKALDSVFSQTYQNFEILLVGDKCPVLDNFINEYEKAKDSRFKWYNLTINGGPGGHLPRNYAIKKMCNSEWITYLDDDNTWRENHLQTIVETIRQNPEANYIVNSMSIDGKDLIFDELRKGRIDTSTTAHKFDLCVKKGLWKDRIEGGYAHDFEFFSRLFTKDEIGVFTKIVTLNYNTEFNHQSYDELIKM